MRKIHFLLILSVLTKFCFSQNSVLERHSLSDSVIKILRKMDLKEWSIHKTGSRIILTKKDSILVATSYSDYKPANNLTSATAVKHQYQLYIDLIEKPLDFDSQLHKSINDSIDKIIRSYKKKKYGRGEYFSSYEAIQLLEKMKVKGDVSLQNINLRFSDNCADDWVPYEMADVKYLPFEPPTGLMKKFEELKKKIADRLRDEGI